MLNKIILPALVAVLALSVTGVVQALSELSRVSQVWTTGYGRLLIVKTALFTLKNWTSPTSRLSRCKKRKHMSTSSLGSGKSEPTTSTQPLTAGEMNSLWSLTRAIPSVHEQGVGLCNPSAPCTARGFALRTATHRLGQ